MGDVKNVTHYDVFNGDADGIISLVQLRLAEPKETVLVTGVKRDIQLLKRVDFANAESITVLDISMEKNADALAQALVENVDVLYVDHHRSGDIPKHHKLNAVIDTDANTCTALLVNDLLQGQYVNWAIVAAFGDNMNAAAIELANQQGLSSKQQEQLKALGVYVNYNGYGQQVSDLHFSPEDLFKALIKYPEPLDLVTDVDSVFYTLEQAYHQDMNQAKLAQVLVNNNNIHVVLLPDEAWSRRVSGVYGNELANQSPDKAHAVLTYNADGTSYTVSVRAPLNNKQGADNVCIQFETGGGRAAAAGINQLPIDQQQQFIELFNEYYC